MSYVNNRIWGSDLSAEVKRKLKVLEEQGAGIIGPNESQVGQNVTDILEDNFRGNAHFSSKTPFARMWTAVSVVEKTDEVISLENPQPAAFDDIDVKTYRYELTPGDNPVLERTTLARTPTDALGKVYSLGTYDARTGDRGVNEAAASEEFDPNSILPTQREKYTDTDFSNPKTRRLRPPAGITSVRTNVVGGPDGNALNAVKQTTVEFTVFDYEEFDQIYSRYFLRPGAQVFVDFGWTHKKNFTLYNPEELLKQEELSSNAYSELIYGKISETGVVQKTGQWQDSDYDIQFVRGLVTDCSADLDPGSLSWNCKITILSENSQIANPLLDEDTELGKHKKNMLSNLDYRIIVLAAEKLFPESFKDGNKLFPNTNFSTNDARKYKKLSKEFASEFLGNKDKNVPNQTNVELGIYWQGNYVAGDDGEKIPSKIPGSIYVSWGWFEDNVLNKEFARGSNFDVDSFDLPGSTEDGSSIRFLTSMMSHTFWSETLFKRQTFMDNKYRNLPFLFPENWDKTYNTRQHSILPGIIYQFEGLTSQQKEKNLIPIREVFIKLDVLKKAISEADTLNEVFTYISRVMQDATGNNWNWQKNEQDYNGFTLGLVDILQVRKCEDDEGNPLTPEEIISLNREDIYDNLYQFNPGSPSTIVKNMSLNMSYGGSDLISSKTALSGLGSTGNSILPVSAVIEQAQSMEIINQAGDTKGEWEKYEVEFVPSSRTSVLKQSVKSNLRKQLYGQDNPDKNELNDTTYLSSGAIYGSQGISIDETQASKDKLSNFIDKSNELKEERSLSLVRASSVPTLEYKDAKKKFQQKGNSYASNMFEYFSDTYVFENVRLKPSIMNFDVNLQLYGTSAFVVGDMFNIGLLPKRIRNLVYFQAYNIEHSVTPGDYTTTIGCQMLLRPDVKDGIFAGKLSETGIVIEPSCLSTEFKIKGISKILPFLLYILPEDSASELTGFDYVFKIKTFKGGNSQPIYELFDSFNIGTDSGQKESDDYFDALLGLSTGAYSLQSKIDDKTRTISKKYSFEAEKDYYIFVKNNSWVIFDTLNTSGAVEYFNILFPPPVPPVNETSVAVAR